MQRLVALGAVGLALAGGFVLGVLLHRARTLPTPPAARTRPAALLAAHRALEDGDRAGTLAALARLGPPADPEDRAEAALLAALARRDAAGLAAVARAHAGGRAAARAHWELVRLLPDGPRRQALLEAFRRRHPSAWVLGPEERP